LFPGAKAPLLDRKAVSAYVSVMKITNVEALESFRLRLCFDDGTAGIADLSHLAGRGVFEAWLHSGFFERVSVTPSGALEWPGEIDLCPDALYLQVTGKRPEEVFPTLHRHLTHA
jgi:hypothetical protein